MHYEDLILKNAPKWPYKIGYAKKTDVACDVLVLGGGVAGVSAAIAAAKAGVKVVLVDKGNVISSGNGATGVDHWQNCPANPCCKFSPDEFTAILLETVGGNRNPISTYIKSRESWGTLLEAENLGMKIRDSEDEFKGAPFRDEKTKLCFAYEYNAKYTIRVWGSMFKMLHAQEAKRLGARIFDRTFVTSLLNEGGKQGAAVVGATGFNTHTGEFYTFKAKATVLCMARCSGRTHVFNSELCGLTSSFHSPYETGDGHAMAFRAGALIVDANALTGRGSGLGFPIYGYGNSQNTYYAASAIDAEGTEIQWIDSRGNVLPTGEAGCLARYLPAKGQKLFLQGSDVAGPEGDYSSPRIQTSDQKYKKPFYTDFTIMPWYERKVIFNMMVAHEGKGLIPIYHTYTQAGFDPDEDMLQWYEGGYNGPDVAGWLGPYCGGLYVDWNLQTNLPRLYAAGYQIFRPGHYAHAATTGRYAGRHAARFAKGATLPEVDANQVEVEKARIYAPLSVRNGMDWKEFNMGVCRVNNYYCVDSNLNLLNIGLKYMDEIWKSEALEVQARNPRELMRVHEVFNIIMNSQMIMEALKAAAVPQKNWLTIKLVGGDVRLDKLPYDFGGDLAANYDAHK